ncbi:MAG: serine/threonine-protein kinase [Sandaracinaceae bacterium]
MAIDDRRPPVGGSDPDDATVLMPHLAEGSFFAGGRYRIERLLGTGAMGRVYRATMVRSGRPVALKVLHQERQTEEETVERFRREAEALAELGHPCIVKVLAFHQAEDGTPYLAMELLEGSTLKQVLRERRFEDPLDLQPIVDGICAALDAAHERGVIHRDMKPDNIFLLESGIPPVKIVDFGLSRLQQQGSITRAGMILGTPRYMAPEQFRDAAGVDGRVDIFSVGVILFEALAGISVYPAEDYGQLLGCVIEGRVRSLEDHRPDLPPALAELVRRAMKEDPAERYATAGELADAFGAAIDSPSRRVQLSQKVPATRPQGFVRSSLVPSAHSTLSMDVSAPGLSRPKRAPGEGPLSAAALASSLPPPRKVGTPVLGDAMRPPRTPPWGSLPQSPPPAEPSSPPSVDLAATLPDRATVPDASGPGRELGAAGPSGAITTPRLGRRPAPQTARGPNVDDLPTMRRIPRGAPAEQPPSSPAPSPPPSTKGPGPARAPAFPETRVGGTMVLRDVQPNWPPPEPIPPRAFSQPAPPPPRPRRRTLGVVLFIVALVVVVVTSAVAGFMLRAYLQRPPTSSHIAP